MFDPNLEIVGFGLFFVIVVLLAISMISSIVRDKIAPPTPTVNSYTVIPLFSVLYKSIRDTLLEPKKILWGYLKPITIAFVIVFYAIFISFFALGQDKYTADKRSNDPNLFNTLITFSIFIPILSIASFFEGWSDLTGPQLLLNIYDGLNYMVWLLITPILFALLVIYEILCLPLQFLNFSPTLVYNFFNHIFCWFKKINYVAKDKVISIKYQPIIPIIIVIGIILLVVSLIMFMITLKSLHAKHKSMNSAPQPQYIPDNYMGDKPGYTYNLNGYSGSGYYLNKNETDFYFNDERSIELKDQFKIIGTTATVSIIVEYLLYVYNGDIINVAEPFFKYFIDDKKETFDETINITNGKNTDNTITKYTLLPATAIDFVSLTLVYGILGLTATSVWLTQQIGVRMGTIMEPPQPVS
jgi:hypothetical protein